MRSRLSSSIAGIALTCAACTPLHAQSFPSKPIRLVVPFAPGGANDVIGRIFAQRISESTGQNVIVDNRAGGGANIGTELVAHAPPDGYMMLYTTNALPVAPALYPKLGYKISDLAPVSLVASFPLIIVLHPSVPAKNLKELISLAKTRGGLSYGTSGTGSINHLSGVLFNNLSGANNLHVPYKGAGPQMVALLSGEIEMGIANLFTAAPHVKSGRMRAIAVTSPKPSSVMPDVPPLAATYPGFDTSLWHGFLTTAGTPPSVVSTLNREVVQALGTPSVREAIQSGGAEPVGTTPAEFTAIIARDVEKYAKLVKISGATAD